MTIDPDKKRECATCHTSLLILKERCDDCETLSCVVCEAQINKGLCHTCDEEELAMMWPCDNCNMEFPHGKIIVYDCDLCDEEHETCLPCYETWQSPCGPIPGAPI